MKTARDLTGSVFGRLTVLRRDNDGSKTRVRYKCQCLCGNKCTVRADHLRSGATQSCKCLNKEVTSAISSTHGMSGTSEYVIWSGMISRCFNPSKRAFPDYGGRGITVCERWRNSFSNFYSDMGPRPSRWHSIDREDNDGNYEPGNCRWATRSEQNRNRRDNHLVTVNGVTRCVGEWSELTGIHPEVIRKRLRRGWSDADSIEPIGHKRRVLRTGRLL
jgi:hypothetical protein